jgi:hypothetical protein
MTSPACPAAADGRWSGAHNDGSGAARGCPAARRRGGGRDRGVRRRHGLADLLPGAAGGRHPAAIRQRDQRRRLRGRLAGLRAGLPARTTRTGTMAAALGTARRSRKRRRRRAAACHPRQNLRPGRAVPARLRRARPAPPAESQRMAGPASRQQQPPSPATRRPDCGISLRRLLGRAS